MKQKWSKEFQLNQQELPTASAVIEQGRRLAATTGFSVDAAPRSRAPKCALYLRASTAKKAKTLEGEEAFRQRPEIQEERLRGLCEQRGWEVAAVYCDRASGRKEARPQLQQLMDDARRGLFGIVAVVAFDRSPAASSTL